MNSVNVNNQFDRYSVTLCGYGYMGDLLKDSENKRWMGPKRYDWSGKWDIIRCNGRYQCFISLAPLSYCVHMQGKQLGHFHIWLPFQWEPNLKENNLICCSRSKACLLQLYPFWKGYVMQHVYTGSSKVVPLY